MSSMGTVTSFPFTAMCGLWAESHEVESTYTGPPAVTSFHGTTWKPPLVSQTPWTSQMEYYTSFSPIPTGAPNPNISVEVFVAKAERPVALIHKKDDKKSDAVALKRSLPTVFGIVSSMSTAAAIASALAGAFIL